MTPTHQPPAPLAAQTGGAIAFDDAHLAEVTTPAPVSGVYVDPAGALILAMSGRGVALQFSTAEDANRLALVALAIAQRMTEREATVAEAAAAELERIAGGASRDG